MAAIGGELLEIPGQHGKLTAGVEVVRGARGEAASSCAGDAVEDGVCV